MIDCNMLMLEEVFTESEVPLKISTRVEQLQTLPANAAFAQLQEKLSGKVGKPKWEAQSIRIVTTTNV